ncbi:MAG TPA: D-2-hydroxyacid dehydrogenase [Gemmatimonadaceae bacterium]|nr:D-2-hydroxyacid dehydrogenase [Gemmatimonadaceae bacterium]
MTTPASRLLVADLAAIAPAWTLPSWAAERLRAAAPADWRVHVVRAPTVSDGDGAERPSDETLGVVGEAEVYVGFGLPRALVAAAPALRWVHSTTAGVASLLHPELRERGILLTNSAGVHAPPMAEYVLAGVLHFLRGLDIAVRQQAEARWDREPFVGRADGWRELDECRALVVGAGGIGQAVARVLGAHGVACTGVRRNPERGAPPGFARVVGPGAIDAELPAADIVVLCAPLTPETRGVLSAGRIARLPEGAIVVNVGRGALLDEAALAERLRAGTLRGAVLDVFQQEPLPADSPLWGLRRALLTPHVSGVSPRRFWERELALIVDNWARYRQGDRLRNLVDQQAGY